MSTVSCHTCGRTDDSDSVIESIQTVGFYDTEAMQYVDDSDPVTDAWEMIALDKSITEKYADGVEIDIDKAVFFCPDCQADLQKL